jgi:RNA polymerase sigma-70 factor (ECF subfamily)
MLGSLVRESAGREAAGPAAVADERAAAFRRLVDLHLDGAYRLAGIILADALEAEDAVHDAVVAAWRGFGGLRDPASFEPWFRRILVNGCRDRLRARTRHRVRDLGRELAEAEHPTQADAADTAAARDAVDRALATLGPDERLIVVMRYHADMLVGDIAAAVGIPEGTVKSRLHTAIGRLRAAMEAAER